MTTFFTLTEILQVFSISLGVGSSTLAIVNFFAAIADGTIDETERRMMGLVYTVLRIAMAAILVTTMLLYAPVVFANGFSALPVYAIAEVLVIAVLFINAMLMTAHLVSSTIGPGLQAGSWYSLGALIALQAQDITNFTVLQFVLAYAAWLVLSIGIVNAVMAILKARKAKTLQSK